MQFSYHKEKMVGSTPGNRQSRDAPGTTDHISGETEFCLLLTKNLLKVENIISSTTLLPSEHQSRKTIGTLSINSDSVIVANIHSTSGQHGGVLQTMKTLVWTSGD
jgi:hypothetical protein